MLEIWGVSNPSSSSLPSLLIIIIVSGIVFAREMSTSPEIPIQIRKNTCIQHGNETPTIIEPKGLSAERKKYLHKSVRPYVREGAKDLTCPIP